MRYKYVIFIAIVALIIVLTIKIFNKKKSDSFDANFKLALQYFKAENYECALEYFKKSAELMPNVWSIELVLARTYHMLGKLQKAIDGYKKVINMNSYC